MSKTSDVTLCKIAVIDGVFRVFKHENRFARVDIKKAIDTGADAVKYLAANWPVRFNDDWSTAKWELFKKEVFDAPDDIFQDSCAFACMCERIMADLDDEYGHNPDRMALLNPIHDVTRLIHNFCDSEGANFVAYELSDQLLNKLDDILDGK